MLLADHPTTTLLRDSAPPESFRLCLRESSGKERTIPLGEGKYTVGSGPRCAIRLAGTGVQPLECVIVRQGDEVRARRWAPNTRLNGIDFDEAELKPGDTLQMGSGEVQVLGPHFEAYVLPEFDTVKTPRPEAEAVELESAADAVLDRVETETEQASDAAERSEFSSGTKLSRRRNPKWLAAFREHRAQYEELLGRVNTLESRLEAALADRDYTPVDRPANEAWHFLDEPTALEETENKELRESQVEDAADDWLVSARAALSRDRSPWMESIRHAAEEPIEPTKLDEFDAEIVELRRQLAESELQAVAAQARIAALEQQLAENRRMLQHFADERTTWQSQLADTEQRLAEYVGRIQELAGQLESARDESAAVSEIGHATVKSSLSNEPSTPVEIAAALLAADAASAPESKLDWFPDASPRRAEDETVSFANESETVTEDDLAQGDHRQFEAYESSTEPLAEESFEVVAEEPGHVPIEANVEPTREVSTSDEALSASREDGPVADEVDSALAHLRELSIWKTEPGADADQVAAADSPADFADETIVSEDQPVSEQADLAESKSPAPASFIDRYSHLFSEDESPSTGPRAPVASSHPQPAPPQSSTLADEEEESVEQYMAKLLKRMRGSAGQSSTPSTRDAREVTAVAAVSKESESRATEEPPTPAEPRPRVPAPKLAADMDALRALANQSARHAIGIHTARTLRRNSFTKLITTLLAGATALFFLLESPSWESLQFVTACIAGIIALYWARLTYVSVMKAARVGAFDDADEDFVAIDGSKLPLPIDGKK